jgi:hypothetical protein
LIFAHLCRKAGFNPDQPRDEQGRWTDTGGSTLPALSDATPDNGWQPGVQYAQNETQRRYRVNLKEEEASGGHTVERHVGKSDDELLNTVRGGRFDSPTLSLVGRRDGSFESLEAANDFVNRTLERNRRAVDSVASGKIDDDFITARFGYITGREAYRPSPDAEPYLRNTYGVGIVIRHDPTSMCGYRVHTAYPGND